MIEAKDLRIGNYFFDRGGKVLKLDFWDGPGKMAQNNIVNGFACHPLTEYTEYANPIPLTEEILIKAGFEPNGVYKSMRLPVNELSERCRVFIVVALNPCECWIEMIDKRTNDKYEELQSHIIKLNGVHSLQNLFYSLTGEELTIMRVGQIVTNLRSGIKATIASIEPETNTIWLNLPNMESEVDYDLDTIKTLWSFEEIDERQIKRNENNHNINS